MQVPLEQSERGLMLAIPESLVQETAIEPGKMVELSALNGKIIIAPLMEREETLDEMLARVTPENIHPEIDFGTPIGQEIL